MIAALSSRERQAREEEEGQYRASDPDVQERQGR